MTPVLQDIEVPIGNAGVSIVWPWPAGLGYAIGDVVLTIFQGDTVILALSRVDGILIDRPGRCYRWSPTVEQSRIIPLGRGTEYEIEVRFAGREKTVFYGRVTGRGGRNRDSRTADTAIVDPDVSLVLQANFDVWRGQTKQIIFEFPEDHFIGGSTITVTAMADVAALFDLSTDVDGPLTLDEATRQVTWSISASDSLLFPLGANTEFEAWRHLGETREPLAYGVITGLGGIA